jgi:hypothetical protein
MPHDDCVCRAVQLAADVIAIFKQAAGVAAPQILARLANFGVQGRQEALDRDLFSSKPDATNADAAKSKPPPPLTAYKPVFPRKDPAKDQVVTDSLIDPALTEPTVGEDVIDWRWPLRPPPETAPLEAGDEGTVAMDGGGIRAEVADATSGERAAAAAPAQPQKLAGASGHIKRTTLELGLRLLDATVMFAVRPPCPLAFLHCSLAPTAV